MSPSSFAINPDVGIDSPSIGSKASTAAAGGTPPFAQPQGREFGPIRLLAWRSPLAPQESS
jgi:hypothetical protein